MPRKGPAPKRPLDVDPVYSSPIVTALVNKMLPRRQEIDRREHRLRRPGGLPGQDGHRPGGTLKRAFDNIRPTLEVKSRRVGGATYQVPIEVKPPRATTLSLRWLVGYARQRARRR